MTFINLLNDDYEYSSLPHSSLTLLENIIKEVLAFSHSSFYSTTGVGYLKIYYSSYSLVVEEQGYLVLVRYS
jgi:hypothetical protein